MASDGLALRQRLPAFGIHLGLSLLLFAALMLVIVFYWYPGPFFSSDGGWRGTLIIICVDLVLGPALTFVVFDPRKERRKILFDLTLIGVVQCVALAWGLILVESQRPVAASLFSGSFHPVTADLVRKQGYEVSTLAEFGAQNPILLVAQLPRERAKLDELSRRAREDHIAPQTRIELFESLDGHKQGLLRQATRTARLLARAKPEFNSEVDAFFDAHPEIDRATSYLVPFNGRYGTVMLVVDGNGRWVGQLTSAFKGVL